MPKSIAMKQETRKLIFVGVAVAVLSTFANQGVDIIANTYDENTWDEELIQAEVKIKKRIEPLEQSVLDLAIGRRETK